MSSKINEENNIEENLHSNAMSGVDDNAEAVPWERLPDETNIAYHAFCHYLRQGHWRSMRKVADVLGKGVSYENQLWKWSAKFNWLNRAQAFDTYVDTQQMSQYLAEQLAAYERRIEHASQLEEKVFNELMSRDVKELKPYELIRLWDIASKIERDTRALKSEVGEKITDTYAHLRSDTPSEVTERVIQALMEAGALSENPDIAVIQIDRALKRL